VLSVGWNPRDRSSPLHSVCVYLSLRLVHGQSAPIQRESALRLIVVHSLAAALVSYFWMGLGWALVAALSKTSAFQGLDQRLLHKPLFSSASATCFICFPWRLST